MNARARVAFAVVLAAALALAAARPTLATTGGAATCNPDDNDLCTKTVDGESVTGDLECGNTNGGGSFALSCDTENGEQLCRATPASSDKKGKTTPSTTTCNIDDDTTTQVRDDITVTSESGIKVVLTIPPGSGVTSGPILVKGGPDYCEYSQYVTGMLGSPANCGSNNDVQCGLSHVDFCLVPPPVITECTETTVEWVTSLPPPPEDATLCDDFPVPGGLRAKTNCDRIVYPVVTFNGGPIGSGGMISKYDLQCGKDSNVITYTVIVGTLTPLVQEYKFTTVDEPTVVSTNPLCGATFKTCWDSKPLTPNPSVSTDCKLKVAYKDLSLLDSCGKATPVEFATDEFLIDKDCVPSLPAPINTPFA